MKIVLYVVLGLIGAVALLILICYVAGSRMSREHRTQITTVFRSNRATVWAALTDYASMPQWWPAVKSVRTERLPDGTELTWNTDAHGQEIAFRTGESKANEKLVRVIASDDLPFGGTWTYELADAPGDGTKLTLTEDGYIKPPIFRSMAKWFFGLDTTMKDFLTHFEARLSAIERKEPKP